MPPPRQSRQSLLAEQSRTPAAVVTLGGFTSIQVNTDELGSNIVGDAANEPSIAVDPTNPDRIVIGWRQFDTVTNSFRQAGLAYSHDGGATWTNNGPLDQGQYRSDPVLGADNYGTFFYLSLSTGFSNQIFRSFDGGVTWSDPIPAFGGDKEWMTIDNTGGLGEGNIYTAWIYQFSCCGGDFSRSRDGGATFSGPIQIPPPKLVWGTLDVGPSSQLYLAGAAFDLQSHVFARAPRPFVPGPVTFDLVHSFDLGGSTGFSSTLNPDGLLGQVNISVDRSSQPTGGNIYVLGSVTPSLSDPLDVHFVRSVNEGNTFSAPVRVNDDSWSNGAWQWFGTMSVAPNGRIDVIWLDTRNDATPNTPTTSELFYSYSLDAGFTWSSNVSLSPSFDHSLGYPIQEKLGDYFHMISDNGGANLAYAATFNGEQDVYFLRIPADCNQNGVPDDEDVTLGGMPDCNGNLVPDACEAADDCNGNSIQDVCELTAEVDCNRNLILDECEDTTDCNGNVIQDLCEVFDGTAPDCNANGIPDECDIASGFSLDEDGSGAPDECEIACCTCAGCIETTEADCLAQDGLFQGEETTCVTTDCSIPNDTCPAAEVLPSDTAFSFEFNNLCADDTEPINEFCDSGIQEFGADLWYEYTTPCCGELTVSLCDNTDYDAIVAIYGGDATCTCPGATDHANVCGDDSCGPSSLVPTVTIPVDAGECYLIRVGGWEGKTGFGTLSVNMSCESDNDDDGLCTAFDNCPEVFNPDQTDADYDGLGDFCDLCPLDPDNDLDGDTVCGDLDNCPTVANTDQADGDADGIGDLCEPTVVYVDISAVTGANTGLDWDNAFNDLQAGLELAATLESPVPVEIWVAAGTYVPSVPTTADPRSVTFDIPPRVRLLGGFAGGEASADLRDPSLHVTILSGDLAGDDGAFPGNNGENAYTVVTFQTPGEPAEVNGVTITRGNSDGPVILPLYANFLGGGVFLMNDGVNAIVRECVVMENAAPEGGGGIAYQNNTTLPVTREVKNTLISHNVSGNGAGMLFNSPGRVTNCRFIANEAIDSGTQTAPGIGGGLRSFGATRTEVVSSEFRGNSADSNGGAIFIGNNGAAINIANTTISGNTASTGGGIFAGVDGGVILTNSIVYGNTDRSGSGEAAQLGSADIGQYALSHSCIEGLTGTLGGTGNIGDDPRFVVPGSDLQIESGSPVIDAGVNGPLPAVDLAGNPRFFDGDGDGLATVDMGAYESQEVSLCVASDAPTAEIDGVKKSRYISFVPGNAGERVALRVTLSELDGWAFFTAETRWVGPPKRYPDEDSTNANRKFTGALLQCAPYYHDWGTVEVLHVFSGDIIPNSTYDVQAIHETCADQLDNPASFSAPLTTLTGVWGDVSPPFAGSGSAQPDFTDISSVVSKFLAEQTAPEKSRSQLQPNCVLPDRPIDFKDITAAVDAFLGTHYSASVGVTGPCTCPSTVVCGATSCNSDSQCGEGFCIDAFCTDACGRCTPS